MSDVRIAVFCGSNHGHDERFTAQAKHLGALLLERGYGLVYGAGDVGLMGVIADAVLEGDGEVIGVIPQALVDREVAHDGLTELHVVETMHERKRMMYDMADAVIAMPGGIGTLDELFETWTWNQLGYLNEPLGVLNVAGYYDPLIEMVDKMVQQGFLRSETRRLLHVSDDAADLLDRLMAARTGGSKWRVGGPVSEH